MVNFNEDNGILQEEVTDLSEVDRLYDLKQGDIIESLMPPDGQPWEIMEFCIKKLHEENHLTQEQATRLTDQIQQVIHHTYTNQENNQTIHDHFYIRINGINIQIEYETGEINLYKNNQKIFSHVYTINDKYRMNIQIGNEKDNEFPDSGLPPNPSLKPAYYKHTNPDILVNELSHLARKIENQDSYPRWISYAIELHEYVKNNIKTQPQKPSEKNVQPPQKTLKYQAGDIGSQITLLVSLYKAAGIICQITISHDLQHDNWRPTLLIKTPENMPKKIIAEKIHQYYVNEIFEYGHENQLPFIGTVSDHKAGSNQHWLFADPLTTGLGQYTSNTDSSPEHNLNRFIYDRPIKPDNKDADDINIYPVALKWVEEYQYINL